MLSKQHAKKGNCVPPIVTKQVNIDMLGMRRRWEVDQEEEEEEEREGENKEFDQTLSLPTWESGLRDYILIKLIMLKTSFVMSLVNNWSIRTQMQKQSSAVAKWENITQVLQPFSHEPSLDPKTLYLVPRPETQELDSVISRVETQLTELEVQRVMMSWWCIL